jgi:hypothetical protein
MTNEFPSDQETGQIERDLTTMNSVAVRGAQLTKFFAWIGAEGLHRETPYRFAYWQVLVCVCLRWCKPNW